MRIVLFWPLGPVVIHLKVWYNGSDTTHWFFKFLNRIGQSTDKGVKWPSTLTEGKLADIFVMHALLYFSKKFLTWSFKNWPSPNAFLLDKWTQFSNFVILSYSKNLQGNLYSWNKEVCIQVILFSTSTQRKCSQS